jgi:hypothetical protein
MVRLRRIDMPLSMLRLYLRLYKMVLLSKSESNPETEPSPIKFNS